MELGMNQRNGRQRTTRRTTRGRRAFAALALSLIGASTGVARAQLPCSYEVTVLPNLSCFGSPGTPVAINNLGHVLFSVSQCAEPGYHNAYLWTGGPTATLIPRPPGILTLNGTDLNDVGLVVGNYGGLHGDFGFIYDSVAGEFIAELPPIDPLGTCWITAINNQNEVCGYRSIGPPEIFTAFRWSAKGFEDFGVMNGPNSAATAIADDGTVVGWTGTTGFSDNTRAFVHRDGVTTILPPPLGGFTSNAWASNSNGQILVACRMGVPGDSVTRMFRVEGNQWTQLLPLADDTYTIASDILESGLAAGVSREVGDSSPIDEPVIWIDDSPISIEQHTQLPSGMDLKGLTSMAENGAATIFARFNNANVAVVVTPSLPMEGDTNCDALVNVADLLDVIVHWGACSGCSTDLVQDGQVNHHDLLEVIVNWAPKGGAT